MIRSCAAWALVAVVALGAGQAWAQAAPPTPRSLSGLGDDVTVIADRLEQLGPELLVATGNVEISRGAARLVADRVEINRETGDTVSQGHVVFYDGEDRLTGDRIDYNFRTGTGVVHDAEARTAPFYRLSGERLERVGDSVYRVRRGVFTTCEADPAPWSFHIGSGTADLNEMVYGTNASFWVRNIPLVPWIPFFAAAIRRERQTGLLFPKFSMSSLKGFAMEQPFYWAISDSQDVTIAPLFYEKRGVGLNLDYRYVISEGNFGSLKSFYVRETARHDGDRGWFAYRHDWTPPGDAVALKADIRGVTTDTVFRTYGDPLRQRSEQRVESNVFLTRRWTTLDFVADAFWYQDLTTHRPVELYRLPQISVVNLPEPLPFVPGALWEVSGSAVRFVREEGSDGTRVDVNPRLSRPVSVDGLVTVTPFVGTRLTAYDRRVTGTHVSTHEGRVLEETDETFRFRRILETGASVESTASRLYHPDGTWGLGSLLHTIEPRVAYTLARGQNLSRLPFWTDIDRLGNQSLVEYSLTNRLRGRTVAPAGTRPVSLEVLRLTLANAVDLERDRLEDVTGDLRLRPTEKVSFRGIVRHDTHGEGVQLAITDLGVQVDRASASVGWRYAPPEDLSFLQASGTVPITRTITTSASTNWDMHKDRFVDTRAGVDLRFQCYELRIEYVNRVRASGKNEDEVRFAISLLGVGGGPFSNAIGLGALTPAGGTK